MASPACGGLGAKGPPRSRRGGRRAGRGCRRSSPARSRGPRQASVRRDPPPRTSPENAAGPAAPAA
eukprot:325277-Lingulodinium_polyedra.AAC.1